MNVSLLIISADLAAVGLKILYLHILGRSLPIHKYVHNGVFLVSEHTGVQGWLSSTDCRHLLIHIRVVFNTHRANYTYRVVSYCISVRVYNLVRTAVWKNFSMINLSDTSYWTVPSIQSQSHDVSHSFFQTLFKLRVRSKDAETWWVSSQGLKVGKRTF